MLTSEPGASQAARLNAQHDSRRSWLDAIHVPRWWSLRRCIERSGDARAALVGFRRPTVVCPSLRDARHYTGLGHPRCVTLDDDVCVADRYGDRAARIARHVAALPGARTCLEPECAVQPESADRGYVRAAVLIDRREPFRASVVRVWSRCRSRAELLDYGVPVHWRQPVRCTQVDDLHARSSRSPTPCNRRVLDQTCR